MKILEIKLKNLNSLSGEWKINLADPKYLNDGIFAITGPTGSGKTTIFDAICLALYGQTPRLGKISKKSNEIMSRLKNECYAQVIFSSGGKSYTCRWGQLRNENYKKADDKFSEAKHEISDNETGEVLANKITDTPKKVEELTGMDFKRFSRAMLLAQGNFDAFLKANKNDRAAILELITGTDIYSRISTKVFEKHRSEKNLLNELKSKIETLTPPDDSPSEEEMKKQISDLKEKQRNLEYSRVNLTRAKDWLKAVDSAKVEMTELKTSKENVEKEFNNFQDDKLKLDNGLKAKDIAGDYAALEIQRETQSEETELLNQKELKLPELENIVKENSEKFEAAQSEYNKAREERDLKIPVLNHIRSVELKLKNREEELNNSKVKGKTLNEEHSSALKRLSEVQEYKTKAEKEFKEATKDINIPHEAFSSEFESCIKKFEESSKERERRGKLMADATMKLEESRNSYRFAQDFYKNSQDKVENAIKASRESQDERDKLLSLRREKVLEDERANLRPGVPCPVCGSTEHPGISQEQDEEFKNVISNLDNLITQADEKFKKLRNAEDLARSAFVEAHQKITEASAKQSAEQKNYEQCMKEHDAQSALFAQAKNALLEKANLAGFHDFKSTGELKQKIKQWTYAVTLLDKKINEYDNEIASLNSEIKTKSALLEEERINFKRIKTEFEELLEERNNIFSGDNAESIQENSINPDEEEKELNFKFNEASKNLERIRKEYEEIRDNYTKIKISTDDLRSRTENRKNILEGLENQFKENLNNRGFSSEEEFLSARLENEVLENLQGKLNELEARKNNIDGQLLNARKKFAELISQSVTNKGTEEVERELNGVIEQLNELQREVGRLEGMITANQELQEKLKNLNEELKIKEQEVEKWSALNELIGSANGDKFRVFAQKQTLGIVVKHANEQLKKMNNRYLLRITPNDENLSLSVIDREQAGEVRPTKNLSGGESFVVSLALALGLSQISGSKTRVNSLFLDEGFGSLDENSLNTALDALSGIQSEGRMIGIISHVQALKERISAQIQVIPKNDGESIIEGSGCEKIG